MVEIKKGFYVHYKGGIYFVHGLARDEYANTLVVYESTQGCGDDVTQTPDGRLWVVDVLPRLRHRSETEFVERVDPVTGDPAEDGVPRFQRVVGWLRGTPLVQGPEASAIPFVTVYED